MSIFDHILFYRIGQFLAISLPLKIGYRLAILISDIHYIFAKADRLNVTENLKKIFPEKSMLEIVKIRRELFRNFAKYLVDFFRFSKLDLNYIKKNINIENIHYIKGALSKGKGVIVLTAHIGNWELGGVIMAVCGYPIWAVALPHKDKRVDHFFNFQRVRKGLNVIPLGRAVKQCLNVLMTDEILALAGDRDFTEKGVVLEFFGERAIFPVGPAIFSLKTGAPIVPGFTIRNKDDSFTLRFESPMEIDRSGNQENDAKMLALKYKNIIEDYIRRYPQQWFMFRRFWIG